MPRRNASLVDVLHVLPWWLGIALAIAGYVFIVHGLPLFFPEEVLRSASAPLRMIGQGWALICGLGALSSAARAFFVARQFEQLRSLDDIRALRWREFESLVGEAFRRRGYAPQENAVGGPDGGVDLELLKEGNRYLVQCKRWRAAVGVKSIRELFGVVSAEGAAGGFFVCSSQYTPDARAFARKSGIELIDGARLLAMINEVRRSGKRS